MEFSWRLERLPDQVLRAFAQATLGEGPRDLVQIEAVLATAWCLYVLQAMFTNRVKHYPLTSWVTWGGRRWAALALARTLGWLLFQWPAVPGALLPLVVGFLPSWLAEAGECPHCHQSYPPTSIEVLEISSRYSYGKIRSVTLCARCGYRHEKLTQTGKQDRHGIRTGGKVLHEHEEKPPWPRPPDEPGPAP